MQSLDASTMQKAASAAVVAIGCLLMAGRIYVDSEPRAIPVLLAVIGIAWHVVTRKRTRQQ